METGKIKNVDRPVLCYQGSAIRKPSLCESAKLR